MPGFTYSGGARVVPVPGGDVRYQGGVTVIPMPPSWGYAPVGPPAPPGTSIYGGQVGVRTRPAGESYAPGATLRTPTQPTHHYTPGTTFRTPAPPTHHVRTPGQRSPALPIPYAGLGFDILPSNTFARSALLAATFALASLAGAFVYTVMERE
jgi:hypothetical protein